MVRSQQDGVCSPIFGFSDKDHYEKFRAECPLSLTPYPLVKRYLQSQIDSEDVALKLVVVDADGPNEPNLHAVRMEDVMEAFANGNSAVTARYRLTFDRATDGYTLEDVVT
jgi:hypothetical protein